MITVKKLKELLNKLPDDAKCYAYEGGDRGIAIHLRISSLPLKEKYWWIEAKDTDEEDEYTEGFE